MIYSTPKVDKKFSKIHLEKKKNLRKNKSFKKQKKKKKVQTRLLMVPLRTLHLDFLGPIELLKIIK